MSKQKKIVLVDGNSLLHRAYHAYPASLQTEDGQLTGAVYGFMVMLFAVIGRIAPSHLVVAWDVSKRTFRHDKYEEYKAGRPEMDKELLDQFVLVKEVVEALSIPQFGVNGFEADDIIGTLATQAVSDGDVVIMTGDKDALQLVDGKKIVVYMPSVGKGMYGKGKDRGVAVYDRDAVLAKYELAPDQIIDLKALMGDSSDNIPGVRGIGQVTATKLLLERGSLEAIYDNVDSLSVSERIKNLLKEGKDMAFKSKDLVTIIKNVPIKLSWDECRLSDYDRKRVESIFERLQFRSLLSKIPADNWEKSVEEVFV